jgi:hypothetical protein
MGSAQGLSSWPDHVGLEHEKTTDTGYEKVSRVGWQHGLQRV